MADGMTCNFPQPDGSRCPGTIGVPNHPLDDVARCDRCNRVISSASMIAEIRELREKAEGLDAVCEDEEVAHQETLDLLKRAKDELSTARAMALEDAERECLRRTDQLTGDAEAEARNCAKAIRSLASHDTGGDG